jgi:hypothetical protein
VIGNLEGLVNQLLLLSSGGQRCQTARGLQRTLVHQRQRLFRVSTRPGLLRRDRLPGIPGQYQSCDPERHQREQPSYRDPMASFHRRFHSAKGRNR